MKSNNKVHCLDELPALLEADRAASKKIVLCHGTFDPLHIGHMRHFQRAKELGDVLVVTVTPDRFVNKGPQRPVFQEDLRTEAVAALSCVDYVALNEWPTAVETIKLLKPNIFVKGSEFIDRSTDATGAITREEEAVLSIGGELTFTDDITFSASTLVNQHLQVFPKEVSEYLRAFSSRYAVADVLSYLARARNLRVLVVGEAIIDEYQYCKAIGKSSKEPTLVVKQLSRDRFAGGTLAIANHVANFAGETHLLTILGDTPSHEAFVRESLNPSVKATLLSRAGAPTIVKRRFIESYFLTKLFEVYEINDEVASDADEDALCDLLEVEAGRYDVVIVADFGHGMLGSRAVDILAANAPFLAVNVQSNAGNFGYHTLSRYPRADFLCINESEVRLDARDRRGNLRQMVREIAGRLCQPRMLVTRGKYGALSYSAPDEFCDTPSLTSRVVDRVGAGDAVLSVTSLCAALDAPAEVVGLIGNAVGAQAVSVLGNQRAVDRVSLIRQIECILK